MALDKEFFDNLEKLQNFKSKPAMDDFFEIVNKLEKIGDEILDKKAAVKSPNLVKQAQDLTKRLEDNRDHFALSTKTQKEFDAVYQCIDYLGERFSSLN